MIGRIDKFISPGTVRRNSQGKAELIEMGSYARVKDRALVIVEENSDTKNDLASVPGSFFDTVPE